VHNEEVVKQIQHTGIKKINRLFKGKGKILLIRAHGCSKETLEKAKKSGYTIIDATCPMVKEIHKIAKKLENNGYRVIIIGDKLHDEVLGIAGQLKSKAIIIDKPENIPVERIKKIKQAGIIVQSTQNFDNVKKILDVLHKYIKQIKFHNTICNPTKMKQEEVRSMPLKNDLMIIIGSKTSANTKRIYELAKPLNKNSYWINSAKEIRKNWLNKAKNIGITAGASTPESTIHEVIHKIKTLCSA
ncbi:MAG: 4-hydroxy-3-methylbut-2-enyl diphosphate reductase, partial [Candidatus Omnitrophota bacterium]|nr:4-hydroxy-3-methylbut-2-enyl diphosphate reductase [Candidatus Omnitrophota bacterium]